VRRVQRRRRTSEATAALLAWGPHGMLAIAEGMLAIAEVMLAIAELAVVEASCAVTRSRGLADANR